VLKEFKQFAMRGSMVDMAVGIVIGAAFGKIVTSLVNDILMPPIGLILGRVNFASLFVTLNGKHYASLAAAHAAGAPTLNYGVFVNTIVDFVIVAFAMFVVITQYQRVMQRFSKAEPSKTRDCPYCLSSIPKAATRCPHCTSQVEAQAA
jgi:large conductance mechanosensitive channel